jgi:hypothetical protein
VHKRKFFIGVVLGAAVVGIPALYALSWRYVATEVNLHRIAVDGVKAIGIERWAPGNIIQLEGFGGGNFTFID